MKISVQTVGVFEPFGIEEGLSVIGRAGFDCVDLNLDALFGLTWSENREGKPSPFFSDPEAQDAYVAKVKAACAKAGVTVGQTHAPFPLRFRGLDKTNEIRLECAKACIRITRAVGCDKIVIHPFFEASMRNHPTSPEEEWEGNMAFYGALIPTLKQYGVTCCLEDMWGQDWNTKKIYVGICSDAAEAVRYIDALNEMAGEALFGFCLDVGHLTLLGLDPYRAIQTLGSRIVALHLHDNSGYGDDHVVPFTGVTIWDRVLRGLAETGYAGTLSFETSNSQRNVPTELIPDILTFTAKVGRYFEKQLASFAKDAD